jgi:hypothetical protein
MELYDHALDEDKGITSALRFTVIRSDEVLQIESYYLFNPNYPWHETETSAFLNHLANSALLGFWAEVKAFFSGNYKKSHYQTVQKLARLKQFHPSAASVGAFAGFFVPSPLTFLRLGKVARGGRVLGAVKTAALVTTFELAELAIYTYKTAPPDRSTEEILRDIQAWVPTSLTIGLASGVFRGGGKPAINSRGKRSNGKIR